MRPGKNLKVMFLITGFLIIGVACSDSKIPKAVQTKPTSSEDKTTVTDDQKVTKLSYQLIEDGCDTEKHSFTSSEELCAGLQNEKLNLFCAPTSREKLFKEKSCKGTYTPYIGEDPNFDNVEDKIENL